eukprot:8314925-Heterocapsa_arctica.AAC.1
MSGKKWLDVGTAVTFPSDNNDGNNDCPNNIGSLWISQPEDERADRSCPHFVAGNCNKGRKCHMRHDKQVLTPTIKQLHGDMDTMNAWLTGPEWTDEQIFGKSKGQLMAEEDERVHQDLVENELSERKFALEDRMAMYGVFGNFEYTETDSNPCSAAPPRGSQDSDGNHGPITGNVPAVPGKIRPPALAEKAITSNTYTGEVLWGPPSRTKTFQGTGQRGSVKKC